MNASLQSTDAPLDESIQTLRSLFEAQRERSVHSAPLSYEQRISMLDSLMNMVKSNRKQLAEAVSADFGNRAKEETELGEFLPIINGIRHARANLKRWMRPQRRRVGVAFKPASAAVVHQPLGVVGILAPWNYPLTLTLAPLTEALAAGNRVIIKPSELTPATSALLRSLIGRTFKPDHVTVVTGGPAFAAEFCALPFDHLFFTGSTHLGRRVMAAAATNLTPVTLELGGKSPVVICRNYPLEKAARAIAIGKLFNAGQTCVAPDYALVPRETLTQFADELLAVAKSLYPSLSDNNDYTSIVSDRHYKRLTAMIDEARAQGATVLQATDGTDAGARRKIAPTFIIGAPIDSTVMREEIFGPVMPIVPYDTIQDAIDFINRRAKPLALYCFSNRSIDHRMIVDHTRSGGVTINGTMMHATQDDLPFGGVGESGTGAYHGRDGFVRFSHPRGVMSMSRFDMSARIAAPPYGNLARWVIRMLIGK